MDETPWPALTFQGFFLAIVIGLMATGNANDWVFWSFVVLMLLVVIQVTSDNPRFLWLYPVNRGTSPATKLPYWDTWALRMLILTAAFLLMLGLTDEWRVAGAIVIGGLLFAKLWDRFLDHHRIHHAKRKIQENIDQGATRLVPTVALTFDQLDGLLKSVRHEQKDSAAKE